MTPGRSRDLRDGVLSLDLEPGIDLVSVGEVIASCDRDLGGAGHPRRIRTADPCRPHHDHLSLHSPSFDAGALLSQHAGPARSRYHPDRSRPTRSSRRRRRLALPLGDDHPSGLCGSQRPRPPRMTFIIDPLARSSDRVFFPPCGSFPPDIGRAGRAKVSTACRVLTRNAHVASGYPIRWRWVTHRQSAPDAPARILFYIPPGILAADPRLPRRNSAVVTRCPFRLDLRERGALRASNAPSTATRLHTSLSFSPARFSNPRIEAGSSH